MIQHFIIEITRWGYMGCSWQLANLLTDFASILQLHRYDTCEMVLKGGLERNGPSVLEM